MVKKIKALSDPNRLKILCLLKIRPACVCELRALLSISQPTLTRHLQKLEENGFIVSTRYKYYQIYRLAYQDEETRTLAEQILAQIEQLPELTKLREHFKSKEPFKLSEGQHES